MKSLTRPGRLLLAVLLTGVLALDAVLFDNYSISIVLLAGFLCVVLVVGSFSPFAESQAFLVSLLLTQVAIAVFLAYQQNYVLAAILGVGSIATVQLLWESRS